MAEVRRLTCLYPAYMQPAIFSSDNVFIAEADHVAALAEERAEALREAREAVKHFHVGSCRWYYTERRCTCGLHDAIDALTTKGATDDVGTG